jgi:hypothetical protein
MPVELRLTPAGSAPVSENVGAGYPVAVRLKEPGVATIKEVVAALVMAGGWSIVSVKFWVAFGDTPLLAVIVIG